METFDTDYKRWTLTSCETVARSMNETLNLESGTHIYKWLFFSTAQKNITSACMTFSGPYQKSWMERPGNFYRVKGICLRDICTQPWLRDSSNNLEITSIIRQKNKSIGGSKNYCSCLSQLFSCLPTMISSFRLCHGINEFETLVILFKGASLMRRLFQAFHS